MDDDGLRNWGYYEPSFKEHLGLQLMSPMGDNRDTKPFLNPRENLTMVNPNGPAYNLPHTRILSESPLPMNYMRDGWIQRERLYHHMLPTNPNFSLIPNTSTSNSIHMMPPIEMPNVEENVDVKKESGGGGSSSGVGGSVKKRGPATTTPKTPRTKKQKKTPKQNGPKTVKKNIEVVINGIDMDISGIPIPVCTCTGSPQQCYRWGSGGWQSACCTTTISIYPLPMSTKRRGARIAGRKMSQGAFKKVLEKLASEGYNFANAIDLKTYWAKHGTNKFVTIR